MALQTALCCIRMRIVRNKGAIDFELIFLKEKCSFLCVFVFFPQMKHLMLIGAHCLWPNEIFIALFVFEI